MGRLRRRLKTLAKKSTGQRTTLVCPECGEEFTCYGDIALEVIVHQWQRGRDGTDLGTEVDLADDVLRLLDHEHEVGAFLDKASGLPFLSKAAGGFDLRQPPEDGF